MSWKKYGGTKNLENFNNITVNNIVSDTFTVREAILNLLRIDGDLIVNGYVGIQKDLTISGNVYVNSVFGANLVTFNVVKTQEAYVSGNIFVDGNIYLDPRRDTFIYGTNGRVGIHTNTPIATLDVSGSYNETLNVSTTQSINKNVLARNNANQGIVLLSDPNGDYIEFFCETPVPASNNNVVPNDINYVADASLSYLRGGTLELNTKNDVKISTNLVVNKRNASRHVLNEAAVIYDISAGTYFYNAYQQSGVTTGSAMSLVANDPSSNTFLNLVTPATQGGAFGGGAFPGDLTRSMAIVGTLDTSGNRTPHQIVVSGTSAVRAKATAGFNTFAPPLDHYAVDINGPLKITNGEISTTAQPGIQVFQLGYSKNRSYPNNLVTVGSPYLNPNRLNSYFTWNSVNGGQTWSQPPIGSAISPGETALVINLYSSSAYNNNFWVVAGDAKTMLYSLNGGTVWGTFGGIVMYDLGNNPITAPIYSAAVVDNTGSPQRFFGAYNNYFFYFDATISTFTPNTYTIPGYALVTVKTNLPASPTVACDLSGGYFYIVGGNTIKVYNIATLSPSASATYTYTTSVVGAAYTAVNVYSASYAVAVGTNVISYTINGGVSWTDIGISGITLNAVYIYDPVNAIAVGNAGSIYYTNNRSYTWQPVPYSLLNTSGIAARITNPLTNLTSVYMPNINAVVVSCVLTNYVVASTAGTSKLFYLYLPNLFNLTNNTNTVLDICGNMALTGSMVLTGQINQF